MPSAAFHCDIQVEAMPPKLEWLEAQIKKQLPPQTRLLQWAIVSTENNLLKIEGSLIS